MTERAVAEKLKYRPGTNAALRYAPEGVELGLPADALTGDPAEADFVLVFASTQAEAEERISALAPTIRKKTAAWVGYPKGPKAAGRDLDRDTIARFAPTVGLVLIANFSIDDTWSAVRMRPLRPGE